MLKTCISPRLRLPYCLHGYARPPAIIQPTDIRLTTTSNRNEHTQTQAGHQGRCNQANDVHLFYNIEMWISEKVMNPAKHNMIKKDSKVLNNMVVKVRSGCH